MNYILLLFILLFLVVVYIILKSRNIDIWIFSYICQLFTKEKVSDKEPIEIFFALADHYEPFTKGASKEKALIRIREWCLKYPEIAKKYIDSNGNHPVHSIFYPEETYDMDVVSELADVCRKGFFDFEIHLHHDNDTSESFREKILKFKDTLFNKHGLLRIEPTTGEIIYAFIHGNWALDNSRKDGRLCGVNDELTILKETGCYADFTLPSAPNDTQTKKINSIYYAIDDPEKPKSHNTGVDAKVGLKNKEGLLMIQGPLCLNWKSRKKYILPGIENGDVCCGTEVTAERVRLWIRNAPSIKGEPNKKFIKVHTHGCQDDTLDYLLNGGLDNLYSILTNTYNDGKKYKLCFVSTYEMFRKIIEIESSPKAGN